MNNPDRTFPVLTITPAQWQAGRHSPDWDPNTFPAFKPLLWLRFFNLSDASRALALECQPGGDQQVGQMQSQDLGGFYSNKDIRYNFTFADRKFGKVLVLHAKAPSFPRTYERERRMGAGQVRYWSLCSYQSRVTTRIGACLADYQVPLTRRGYYTIVVSRPKDRPRDAVARCGVAWLSYPCAGTAPETAISDN